MSNRTKEDVVREDKEDTEFFVAAGLEVLSPVAEEKVESKKEKLLASKEDMDNYWYRDKELIRKAHVVLDMTPHLKSFGTEKELGYARYHLWKKVIRVFPQNQLPWDGCVAYMEDDDVVDSREMALESILRTHGTWFKRLKWRWAIYNRCFLKALWYRLGEWK